MCGILGSNTEISESDFHKVLKTLDRRGPDIQSAKKTDTFYFGHTRLAIVDLDERSNQPFFYAHEGKEITLTFNGEIYNFLSVKSELEALNFQFTTSSDTEVVAAAYLAWGKASFDKFEGMWALAVYEEDTKKIIFSRDRVGKKPLYIFDKENGEISFSSALKSIKEIHHSIKFQLNQEAISLYFALGFVPGKHSIYKDIYKVRAGEIIEYSYEAGKGYFYENNNFSSYSGKSDPKRTVKSHIEEAVKNRMISDVPYCTLLSSGVDSSIVTYYSKKHNPTIEAFTVGFNDPKLNELEGARKIAKRIGVKLNELYLDDADIEEAFLEYYNAYEEPFADYSGIPTLALFKKIGKHYRLAFTGDGGDELFFGYPHYWKKYVLYKLNRIQRILPFIKNMAPAKIRNIISCKKEAFESEYLKLNFCVTESSENYINMVFSEVLKTDKNFMRATIEYDRKLNNLPDKYLVKVDRASMAYSVEVRSPLMDERLKKKTQKTSLWKIFTPFSLKLYLKLKYIKLFGLNYLFAKKKGFTPPVVQLINNAFSENEYAQFLKIIKTHHQEVFAYFENISFNKLKNRKLQYQRVYFFYEWLKSQKYDEATNN
ncbi:asparagine synthase (glutamine-hydrolyzing) [uncultured Kordia sp.]|uniref:asparagine synthase (glutamine-hydrolyzing) n=1 Tax=uncultured Kordia sp. TaxID=507699 RepID=UPI002617ABFE|nr:asparagine synthase (glutamine-hydrolyzing) [uncultured Kordia sp.]